MREHPDVDSAGIQAAFGDVFAQAIVFHGFAVYMRDCWLRSPRDPPIYTADGCPAWSDSAMQIWLFRVSCIGPLDGSMPSAREAGAGVWSSDDIDEISGHCLASALH
jgi:hypothetical protein